MLDEMLTLDPDRIAEMHSPSPQHPGAPAPDRAVILARMLERQDWFTQAKSAKLLSLALKTSDQDNAAIRSKFLEWLTAQFHRPSNPDDSFLVASGALAGLLRTREVRQEYSREVPLLVCIHVSQFEQWSWVWRLSELLPKCTVVHTNAGRFRSIISACNWETIARIYFTCFGD